MILVHQEHVPTNKRKQPATLLVEGRSATDLSGSGRRTGLQRTLAVMDGGPVCNRP